ncbi:MFS transporter [Actinomycetospora sp. NBRC 106375]|uniref:MFS transporter n=1 Tax=Actinomycetospora sp. NBRC 106375 TaxID=3032207 RepID=UPI0024A1AB74|nr:MFS transporter [Actinomycetospora sp. NBRC 106375]GLZ46900.1 MFS transporter [Actinomycetospora sp. NBRC 106375]
MDSIDDVRAGASTGDTRAVTQDTVARLERLPFGRVHFRVAALLGTGTFFDAFDSLVIASVLTVVVTTFGVGFGSTGLLISSAYVGQFVGAIALGALAERYGRRTAFIISLGSFGLLSLAAAFSWNFESLLVFRLLQGIGLGAEVPIAGALFNEFVRGRARGRIVMIYESIFSWGILLAPLIGLLFFTLFGQDVGWRLLFGFGALPVIVAIIAWFKLPESPRWLADRGRGSEAEALLAEMEADARRRGGELPAPEVTPPVTARPTRFGELFSQAYRSRTILSWVTWFCGYFILYGFSTWLPTLYVRLGGLPTGNALALTAVASAIYLVEIYAFAFTVDRVGRKPWFVAGFAVAVLGAAVGAIAIAMGAVAWPVLFIAGLLMGLGISPVTAGLYLYTPELYPTRMRAWATATGSSLNRVASAIGPILVGVLLGAGLGLSSVFIAFGAVAIVGLVVMTWMGIETKQRVLEELAP